MDNAEKRTALRTTLIKVFVFLGVLIGYVAGGHKDFRESTSTNLNWTVFDASLWMVAILLQIVNIRQDWQRRKLMAGGLIGSSLLVKSVYLIGMIAGMIFFVRLWAMRTGMSDY